MKEIRKQKKKKKKRRKIEKGLGASLSAQEGSQPAAHLGILNWYAFFSPSLADVWVPPARATSPSSSSGEIHAGDRVQRHHDPSASIRPISCPN
jgi:hypothetical protein